MQASATLPSDKQDLLEEMLSVVQSWGEKKQTIAALQKEISELESVREVSVACAEPLGCHGTANDVIMAGILLLHFH